MITIHIDGLCQPSNPGGYGCWAYVAVNDTGREVARNYGCVGKGSTNNIAEYQALIEALKRATKEGWAGCQIRSDSQLVVNQVNGSWKVNQPHILTLAIEARKLLTEIKATLTWIPREQNERADHLSNVAYNQARLNG